MATKPILLLGLVVAALVLPFAHALTIYNPAGLVVDIQMDDMIVQVNTPSVTMDLNQEEMALQVSVGDGQAVVVNVHNGDVLVVIPDPADSSNVMVFRVMMASGEQPVVKVDPAPPRRFAAAPAVRAHVLPPSDSAHLGTIPNPAVRP